MEQLPRLSPSLTISSRDLVCDGVVTANARAIVRQTNAVHIFVVMHGCTRVHRVRVLLTVLILASNDSIHVCTAMCVSLFASDGTSLHTDLFAGIASDVKVIGANVCKALSAFGTWWLSKTSPGVGIGASSTSALAWLTRRGLANMKGAPIKDKYLSMRGKTCSSSSVVDRLALAVALCSTLSSVVCLGMRAVQGGAAAFALRS